VTTRRPSEAGSVAAVPRRFKYDVCLSFAGEQREYVREIASRVTAEGLRVFFDEEEQQRLWGTNLLEELDRIYRLESRFCVMFISQAYAETMWARQERRSAQARALLERGRYLLPARFDDTQLDGFVPTTGYIDLRQYDPATLADLIVRVARPPRLRPRVQIRYLPHAEYYVQEGHMVVEYRQGNHVETVPSHGWTHRIGVYNPSGVRLTGVNVRLTAVKPAPRFPVLPVMLRKKDDNTAPYFESHGFTVNPGATEFVDLVMKSSLLRDLEVQHAVVNVSRSLLPPVSIVTLEATAANLPKPQVARFSVRLTLVDTVEIHPVP
jgi:TIR domain